MNKVRITYTVSLADVPKETQTLIDRLRKENQEISKLLSNMNFIEDFAISSEKLKSVTMLLDKAQTTALDVLNLSEGFIELQNRVSTKEPDQQDNEDLPPFMPDGALENG